MPIERSEREMTSDRFDILIVGAGPAGSFAAEHLARAGVRVALFDGRPAGEPKACGGGVTSKALKAWPHLLETTGRLVEDLELYSPSGKRLYLKLAEPFAIYSRLAFDSHLRERARAAGATVFAEKVSVELRAAAKKEVWTVRSRSGAKWSAEVLAAADGANSPIAKRLAGPLPPAEMEVAFGYRAPLPKGDEVRTVISFLPGWDGYAWAFPRLDHISFGIATAQETFNHKSLDSLLWRFMIGYYRMRSHKAASLWSNNESAEERMQCREIKTRLLAEVEPYAARIPKLKSETWDTRRIVGENWALIGDAAGFADPITGEGIYYALRSAELFAKSYLEGELSRYGNVWMKDCGYDLRRAAAIRRRFYGGFLGSPFTERMIEFARLHRGIRRTLRDLVAGDQGYIDLKHKLIHRVTQIF
jgi:geranylgeranyl reductase family protein